MTEVGLSTNVLLLIILSALTLIGYMIAINSHGAARMSLSYLLATILLALSIFAILQHLNGRIAQIQQEKYEQKVVEAEQAGEANIRQEVAAQQQAKAHEEALSKKKLKAAQAAESKKIAAYIARAQKLARNLKGVQLQGYGKSYDELTANASSTLSSVTREKKKFKKVSIQYNTTAQQYINRGYEKLSNAARYYTLFYRADNTSQEVQREKTMRRSAAEAANLFQQAQDALK